jgi:hypothetical protein
MLAIHKLSRRFQLQRLAFDPHQAQLMASRLKRRGIACEEVNFVGANLDRMAMALTKVIRARVVRTAGDLTALAAGP